ncbi:MAG: SMC-Scp complex subunit ScpB [Patescibacteria group bacterium]
MNQRKSYMSKAKSKIESLLFISHKPLSVQKIAELTKSEKETVKNTLNELMQQYQEEERGFQIMKVGQSYQMVSAPDNGKIIKEFLKDEQTGEMTKPSLETLTIIAYRGPITKAELDMIRGVNCSLILRNLMIKGLVESKEDKSKMQTVYGITFDFMRHLGISQLKDLPDYEKLNQNDNLDKLLHPEETEAAKQEQLQSELNNQESNQEPEPDDTENPS